MGHNDTKKSCPFVGTGRSDSVAANIIRCWKMNVVEVYGRRHDDYGYSAVAAVVEDEVLAPLPPEAATEEEAYEGRPSSLPTTSVTVSLPYVRVGASQW